MKKILSIFVTLFVFVSSFVSNAFAETKAVDMFRKRSNKKMDSTKKKMPVRPDQVKFDNLEKAEKAGKTPLWKDNDLGDSSKLKFDDLERKK